MSLEKPLVSIYLPCHNYGRYVKSAIESVLKQTYDNWELLIYNDNSEDNTKEILNLYRGLDKIKIHNTAGIGLINVANRAISEAGGKYIIRLDADDMFDEDILLILVNRLEQNDDLGLVFPDYYLIDEYDEIISLERREKIFKINNNPDIPAHGACTLFRLSFVKDVGGYDAKINAQDGYYLWNKILSKHKGENVNLPLFFYRKHGTNLTKQSVRILTARRKIKFDQIRHKIEKNSPINVVIPCRKNYDFRSDLWSLPLGEKTLLEYSLDACIGSKLWDNIIVASDNNDIKKILNKYDDKRIIYFKREMKDTIRQTDICKSLEKISKVFDPKMNGITVISYVQSPFVKKETLEEAVYTMLLMNADSAFTVEELKFEVFKRGPHGLVSINPPNFIASDYQVLFKDASSAFASRTINFSKGSLYGSKVTNYYTVDDESHFIDSEKNYKIAQGLYENIEED